MQHLIQLTLEEYEQLKNEKPSTLLNQTISNLKAKNQELLDKLSVLQTELDTYVLGGAKPRQADTKQSYDPVPELVKVYNESNQSAVKPALEYASKNSIYVPQHIKKVLKEATNNNIIYRDKHNKYHFTEESNESNS
jgi:hypothetical protein